MGQLKFKFFQENSRFVKTIQDVSKKIQDLFKKNEDLSRNIQEQSIFFKENAQNTCNSRWFPEGPTRVFDT